MALPPLQAEFSQGQASSEEASEKDACQQKNQITLERGSSLWTLAREHHVPLGLLEQVNKIAHADAAKLPEGLCLKLPTVADKKTWRASHQIAQADPQRTVDTDLQQQTHSIVAPDPIGATDQQNNRAAPVSPKERAVLAWQAATREAADAVEHNSDLQRPAAKAMRVLEMVTRALNANETLDALDAVWKSIEDYESLTRPALKERHDSLLGRSYLRQDDLPTMLSADAMVSLMKVFDRTALSDGYRQALERSASLGLWNRKGATAAMAAGASQDYVFAMLVQQHVNPNHVFQASLDALRQLVSNASESAVEYGAHLRDLNWRAGNLGRIMTEERAAASIEDNIKKKGEQWIRSYAEHKSKWQRDGARLRMFRDSFDQLPERFTELKAVASKATNQISKNLLASSAIKASEDRPEYAIAYYWETFLRVTARAQYAATAKLVDQSQKLWRAMVKGPIQAELILSQIVEHLDAGNFSELSRIASYLELQAGSSKALFAGLPKSRLTAIATDLHGLGNGADIAAAESLMAELRSQTLSEDRRDSLSKKFKSIKPFHQESLMGRGVRMVGAGAAVATLAYSLGKYFEDPNPKTEFKVALDVVNTASKSADFLAALGYMSKPMLAKVASGLTHTTAKAGLAVLSSINDFWDAGYYWNKNHDKVDSAMYVARGVGGAVGFLGSGVVSGVGFGVIIGAVGVQAYRDMQKQTLRFSPENDHGESEDMLAFADIQQDKRRRIAQQSPDGYSIVPLIVEQARAMGLISGTKSSPYLANETEQRRLADWINGMSNRELDAMCKKFQETVDELEGNIDHFGDNARPMISSSLSFPTSHFWPAGREADAPPRTPLELKTALHDAGVPPMPQASEEGDAPVKSRFSAM